MKPFNLEEAKSGNPVCTRLGRDARIIFFDKKGSYPIVALIDYEYIEEVIVYDLNGKSDFNDVASISAYDLFMKD